MKELIRNNKAFRAIIVSDLFETIGAVLFNIVFLIYAAQLPNKTLAISVVSFMTVMPMVLQAFLGNMAGRIKQPIKYMLDRRLFQTVLYLLEAGLFFFGDLKSWTIFIPLLLINFVSDLTGGLSSMVSMPIIKHVVPNEKREVANGLQTAISSIVSIVGQVLGATLIVIINYRYDVFALLNALMFAIAFLALFSSRTQLEQAETESQIAIKQSRAAAEPSSSSSPKKAGVLKMISASPIVLFILVFGAMINFFGTPVDAVLNLMLLSHHALYFPPLFNTYGQSVAVYGSVFSIGMIISALLMEDFLGKMKITTIIILLEFVMAVLGLTTAFFPNRWLLLILMFTMAYILGKLNPKIGAMMMRVVPEHQLAAIMGIFGSIMTLAMPVGQLVFLTIANVYRPADAWLVMGISSIFLFVLSLVFYRKSNLTSNGHAATQTNLEIGQK